MKVEVKVQLHSKRPGISKGEDGSLLVCPKLSLVDGKANQELLQILAKHFGVVKRDVAIVRGQTSRTKLIEIAD